MRTSNKYNEKLSCFPWISLQLLFGKLFMTVDIIFIIPITRTRVGSFLIIIPRSASRTAWASWYPSKDNAISYFLNKLIFIARHRLQVFLQHLFKLFVAHIRQSCFFIFVFRILVWGIALWAIWSFWLFWIFFCCFYFGNQSWNWNWCWGWSYS